MPRLQSRWGIVLGIGLALALVVATSHANAASVRAGTSILVRTTDLLTSESSFPGSTIDLEVVADVVVDGVTVIEAGAPAEGIVSDAKKKGFLGKPGKLTIEIRSVQKVDGKKVLVRGSKSVEGEDKMLMAILCTWLIKGGSAEIAPGTQVEVTVVSDVARLQF